MRHPCYLFDIDGTLADGEHRIHHIKKQPKDWDAYFADCGNDLPITHMVELCRRLATHAPIVFVSGRRHETFRDTVKWLNKHVAHDWPEGFLLFMRKKDDRRDDNIIKIELLEEVREHGFEPIMAFDDRNRVVEAWRAAGIPCAQVAPGDF